MCGLWIPTSSSIPTKSFGRRRQGLTPDSGSILLPRPEIPHPRLQDAQIHHKTPSRSTHLGQCNERGDGRELLGSQRSRVCGEQSRACLAMLPGLHLRHAWGGSMASARMLLRRWCRLRVLRSIMISRLPRCCSRIAARLVVAVRARHVARGVVVASHGMWQRQKLVAGVVG